MTLVAFSTYRSYAYQKALFDKYVARDGYEKASTYSAE
ncbi:D-alanyl-D-alanine carboxypeptidase family protein [Exiguobacterium sp. SL14]|nr:D-alanyl-D-alanine carboxypeptidase family protein [Exiguobacterium sp. SL14]MCY1692234.1 D-alanyl-D-alanine carboxypeptidase family protein [Exiguobacterium sp. SL14]